MSQEVNDETVLIDLKTEAYFGLNQTGTRIWQLLGENRNVAEIASVLTEEFETTEESARVDLEDLLNALLTAGLIVPNESN